MALLPLDAFALVPEFRWARQAAATGGVATRAIAADRLGNSYVTGWFIGTATFGGKTLTSDGEGDIFVAKYDGDGKILWARRAGGSSFDEGAGIAVDVSGNCYVTGYFSGTGTFGGVTLTSRGNGDIVIAKYDSAGNVKWAKAFGGSEEDRGNHIALDGLGNCYVTGFFNSATATFGGVRRSAP